MENATKALLMASGTLMGIMLLALMLYFFRSLSPLEETRQKTEETEQLTAFNEEYNAYEKKLMYGVDLISVLNKAKSNNEKYAEGKYTAFAYGNKYLVDIQFTLKKTLEDQIIVNYLPVRRVVGSGSTATVTDVENREAAYGGGNGPSGIKIKDVFDIPKVAGQSDSVTYLGARTGKVNKKMEENTALISQSYESEFKGSDKGRTEPYKLLINSQSPGMTDEVLALLSAVDCISQYKKNTSARIEDKIWNRDDNSSHGWSSAEWRTALYDLKSRKFSCVSVEYDDTTGRINKMVFNER